MHGARRGLRIAAWFVALSAVLTTSAFAKRASARGDVTGPPSTSQHGIEAPALALPNAHRLANERLSELFLSLDASVRARLTGMYVAFDDRARDPYVLGACDDDGDYVVVVSDAMLVLTDYVAQTAASNDARAISTFARFTAEQQRHGARVVSPPPGSFGAPASDDGASSVRARARQLFGEIVASLVAHELAHAVLGHFRCAHPTATHERNDDAWTDQERATALTHARSLYSTTRTMAADRTATWLLFQTFGDGSQPLDGPAIWCDFAGAIEGTGEALATYFGLHGGVRMRGRLAKSQWETLAREPPSESVRNGR